MSIKYKNNINIEFLKSLFNEKKKGIPFNDKIYKMIDSKFGNQGMSDMTDLLRSKYNTIRAPYIYSEIEHLKKLLLKLYYKTIAVIKVNNTDDAEGYEELILPLDKFDIKKDFTKLYNSIYYCLKFTNMSLYKIYKKKIGRSKDQCFFILKVVKPNQIKYISFTYIKIDDKNCKLSIEEYENYDYLKRVLNISSNNSSKSKEKKKTFSSTSNSRSRS